MQIYMVGGAVRDALLGLPVQDRDWVLVGADPQTLAAQGYLPVGKDFPVFLHPDTREEYALARTERKTAPGYHGFAFHAAADVTLEQDLARRDLTINAMAVAQRHIGADGSFPAEAVEDPFGGRMDLQQRVLRHVTDAFREDPVRILRLARFAARFADFGIAPETRMLVREMVDAGEAAALVAERVWQEVARGLMERTPSRMLQVLASCGALAPLLPELAAAPQAEAVRVHRVLDAAHAQGLGLAQRFALLCEPLHQEPPLRTLCERLRVPADCRDMALLLLHEGPRLRQCRDWDAAAVVASLERCDAFRRPGRYMALLQACRMLDEGDAAALTLARQGYARLQGAVRAALDMSTTDVARAAGSEGLAGPQIAERIRARRVQAVAAWEEAGPGGA